MVWVLLGSANFYQDCFLRFSSFILKVCHGNPPSWRMVYRGHILCASCIKYQGGNHACGKKNKNFPLVKIRRYLVDFNLLFYQIHSLTEEDIKRDSEKKVVASHLALAANATSVVN